jgi:2-amino-4-hydroxy-6-hydroxymethyldihydropteridine diphosphokinase
MKAVIAIGANLGNPQENIDLAVALLREATDLTALSSMYVTKPVGGPAQPDYINAVALAESDLQHQIS